MVVFIKTPLIKYPVQLYLSDKLKSDVKIDKCNFSFKQGIIAGGVIIKNEEGLYCAITQGRLKINPSRILERAFYVDYSLRGVEFSHPSSKIIEGISELFNIDFSQYLIFTKINGGIELKRDELTVKNLYAKGRDVSFYLDGTTSNSGRDINYTCKLLLSEKLTGDMPESTRELFFKKGTDYSTVQLYLSGKLAKPTINFSTPLFKIPSTKLKIR